MAGVAIKPTSLTQEQIDAVVGMTLGDMHIERRTKGSRLKICQGFAQKDLVFFLYNLFTGLVGAVPRHYTKALLSGRVRSE